MTNQRELDRRTVLKGTAAIGAAASVAGCSSLPIVGDDGGGGGDGDLSYGDEVQEELDTDSETDPFRDDVPADSYEFEGSEGDQVRITMESDPIDPYLTLTDSEGNLVAQNDDHQNAAGRWGAQINTTLPADDTYTIWASRYGGTLDTGDDYGPYTLSLERL